VSDLEGAGPGSTRSTTSTGCSSSTRWGILGRIASRGSLKSFEQEFPAGAGGAARSRRRRTSKKLLLALEGKRLTTETQKTQRGQKES